MTVVDLSPEPASVPRARRFVRDVLAAEGVDAAVAAPTVLLTSEIVTNSVIHGDGVLQLRIEVADEAVRVEVSDAGSGCPVREDVPLDADRGRGLNVVARLATRWGVSLDVGRTMVWFELRSPRHPSQRERQLRLDAIGVQARRLLRRIRLPSPRV